MAYIIRKLTNLSKVSILILLCMFLGACSFFNPIIDNPINTPTDTSPIQSPTGSPIITPPQQLTPDEEVQKLLSEMTLEEKVGQMFFIGSRYNMEGQKQLSVDQALLQTLKEIKPGGFILFAENLDTIEQTKRFISDIQNSSDIPLFIGIDEEGGIVSRLNKASKLHSTKMPDPYTIGKTKNPEYAFKATQAIASEIKSLGFNMNFAPVADVFSNPQNTVIGKRAYSSDAKLASEMVAKAVKGYMDGGIIPVLKHFPGHGDTSQDSHTSAAIVENDINRLRELEFLPFKAGMDQGIEVIMTAHVLTPKITNDKLPATLSSFIINDILREELGFDGLVITDGLEMSAISYYYPENVAVVMAIEAGVDMLLLPMNAKEAFDSVISSVKEGRIKEERINESVSRILKVKVRNIMQAEPINLDPEEVLGSTEHHELAEKIKQESE